MAEQTTTITKNTKLTLALVVTIVCAALAISGMWYTSTGATASHMERAEGHETVMQLEEHFPPREVVEMSLEQLKRADARQEKALDAILKEVRK